MVSRQVIVLHPSRPLWKAFMNRIRDPTPVALHGQVFEDSPCMNLARRLLHRITKPKRSAQETQAVCRVSGISFCLLGLRHCRGDSTFPVKIGGRCAGSSHTPPYFTTPTHGSPSLSPMVDRAPGREGARERLSDRAAQVGQALEVPARPQRCVQDVARPQQLLPARHSVERRILAQPVRPQ
jgi:hypothetical protein